MSHRCHRLVGHVGRARKSTCELVHAHTKPTEAPQHGSGEYRRETHRSVDRSTRSSPGQSRKRQERSWRKSHDVPSLFGKEIVMRTQLYLRFG